MTRATRRAFLGAAAGATLTGAVLPRRAAGQALPPPPLAPVPRVNGAINVQPLRRFEADAGNEPPLIVPALVDIQLRALYELGFERIRITLSWNRFGADFLAAIPYVRAARALGLDVLGIASQFTGLDFAQALSQNNLRGPLLRAYAEIFAAPILPAPGVPKAGGFAFQIMNEPVHSLGVTPGTYVRRLLALAYQTFKQIDPELLIVSAAEVGTPEGVLRERAMIEGGLEDFCDRVAYHVYDRSIIPRLAGMATRPVWITESGVQGTVGHRQWVEQVFPEIRRTICGVEHIFYFVLFDRGAGQFRLIDIVQDPDGSFRPVVESTALVARYAARVAEAGAGQARASYRDLIPDVTLYFPTAEDLSIIASVPALALP